MSELLSDFAPCSPKMAKALLDGIREGGKDAVDVAIELDQGEEKTSNDIAKALMDLMPLVEVLRAHLAISGSNDG
tara:strand:- start:679 stop:903 length:225 start_codon:yes stop_codon:yes gene_type:complete